MTPSGGYSLLPSNASATTTSSKGEITIRFNQVYAMFNMRRILPSISSRQRHAAKLPQSFIACRVLEVNRIGTIYAAR